jgi:membrane protease YdiL (CAAX protease family)
MSCRSIGASRNESNRRARRYSRGKTLKLPNGMESSNLKQPSPSSELLVLSCLGGLYELTSVFRLPVLETVFGYVAAPSRQYMTDYGPLQFVAVVGYFLSFALAILMVIRLWPTGRLARSLHLSASLALRALVVSVIGSILLDATNLWPFSWRWESSHIGPFANVVQHGRHAVAAYLLWLFAAAGLTPIVEEAVFRVGILQLLALATRSTNAGIVGSALLFGLAHLPWWDISSTSRGDWANGLGAVVLGLLFGWFAQREGSLSVPLAAHVGRNGVEILATLFST